MRADLVLDALRMALALREPGADFELVAHADRGSQYTDRGSQYTSADHTQELDDHGALASVGSVGDAFDNAMAESFVDTFKTEPIADRVWRSRSPSRGVRGPIRSTGGPTEQSLLDWKPTKTVSVELGPAHIAIDRVSAWTRRELPSITAPTCAHRRFGLRARSPAPPPLARRPPVGHAGPEASG
jgi:transposase InsO family protein